jgi:hypothetical protein
MNSNELDYCAPLKSSSSWDAESLCWQFSLIAVKYKVVNYLRLKSFFRCSVLVAFLSVYVYISLSTGWRVLKLGKATEWTSRSTVIGRIYFDDENMHDLVVVV